MLVKLYLSAGIQMFSGMRVLLLLPFELEVELGDGVGVVLDGNFDVETAESEGGVT